MLYEKSEPVSKPGGLTTRVRLDLYKNNKTYLTTIDVCLELMIVCRYIDEPHDYVCSAGSRRNGPTRNLL